MKLFDWTCRLLLAAVALALLTVPSHACNPAGAPVVRTIRAAAPPAYYSPARAPGTCGTPAPGAALAPPAMAYADGACPTAPAAAPAYAPAYSYEYDYSQAEASYAPSYAPAYSYSYSAGAAPSFDPAPSYAPSYSFSRAFGLAPIATYRQRAFFDPGLAPAHYGAVRQRAVFFDPGVSYGTSYGASFGAARLPARGFAGGFAVRAPGVAVNVGLAPALAPAFVPAGVAGGFVAPGRGVARTVTRSRVGPFRAVTRTRTVTR